MSDQETYEESSPPLTGEEPQPSEEGQQPGAEQATEKPEPRKPGIFGNSADLTDEEKEELVAAGFDIPKPIEAAPSEPGDSATAS